MIEAALDGRDQMLIADDFNALLGSPELEELAGRGEYFVHRPAVCPENDGENRAG